MSLLCIHGRAQQAYSEEELKSDWISAISEGLAKWSLKPPKDSWNIQLPYYATTLMQFVEPGASSKTRGGSEAQGVRSDSKSFEDEFKAEAISKVSNEAAANASTQVVLPNRAGVLDKTRSGLLGEQDSPVLHGIRGRDSDDVVRDFFNQSWALALSRWLDNASAEFSAAAVDHLLQDVGVYLTNRAASDAVNKIVIEAIGNMTEPRVIVAHSLGTVVAYRILYELGSGPDIAHFFTVGCPLGVNAVKKRIFLKEPKPAPGFPPRVLRWTNGADPRDIVALAPCINRKSLFDQTTSDSFEISNPPLEVINLSDITNITENHHGIGGYLNDPIIARRIFESLSSEK